MICLLILSSHRCPEGLYQTRAIPAAIYRYTGELWEGRGRIVGFRREVEANLVSVRQCCSTFVRPRPGKLIFFSTRREPGHNRFTSKYLSNFFQLHTLN